MTAATAPVTMYTTSWCGYCVRLKKLMQREGIEWAEVNIEHDEAAAGLLLATGIRIARPLLRRPWPALVALVCVLAIAVFRLPLLPTMIVLTPLAILASRRSAA